MTSRPKKSKRKKSKVKTRRKRPVKTTRGSIAGLKTTRGSITEISTRKSEREISGGVWWNPVWISTWCDSVGYTRTNTHARGARVDIINYGDCPIRVKYSRYNIRTGKFPRIGSTRSYKNGKIKNKKTGKWYHPRRTSTQMGAASIEVSCKLCRRYNKCRYKIQIYWF